VIITLVLIEAFYVILLFIDGDKYYFISYQLILLLNFNKKH